MTRASFLAISFAAGTILSAGAGHAQQKQVVTFGHTGEVTYEPFLYALKTGKVTSPTVEVKPLGASIPALLQAMGTRQYDLVENTVLGVPTALERGLDIVVVTSAGIIRNGRYLMVKKDSSIQTPGDLKGKVVGMTALASTASAHLRFVLAKKYQINVALQNGSYEWVDLPLATLPAALLRDQISGAYMFHTAALKSLQAGEFRSIVDMPKEYRELFGADPITSVVLSYKSVVAERADAIREAVRLLQASANWARTHSDEVYAAVGKENNVDPKDLKVLAQDWYEVNFNFGPAERKMVQTVWTVGQELGLLKSSPKLDDIVWQ
jgi:NitT/TauT family transport system substrate-binding protein